MTKGKQCPSSPQQFGTIVLLPQYFSYLTAKQITEGINLARANAKRLVADAKILLENKAYSSAALLAILSIEEGGKELILQQLALCRPPEKTGPHWKAFRNHQQKNKAWLLPFISKEAKSLKDLSDQLNDPAADHPALLDTLKQACVYTDCVGNRTWQTPDIMDELHATRLVELADVMLGERGDIPEQQIVDLQEMTKKGHVTKEEIAAFMRKHGQEPMLPITDSD